MPSHYWIKLYHEILSDPKMGRLSDRTWRRAIELFLLAGDTANDGTLPLFADIAWALRVPEAQLLEDLEALAEVGITTLNGDRWHVTNFGKRQAPVSNAQRQRQYRNKQRTLQDNDESITNEDVKSNESITKRNADTDTDTDIDIETEEKKNMGTPSAATALPHAATVKVGSVARESQIDSGCNPPPPPKQSKSKRKSQKPPTPEAVKVFRTNAHKYPPKAWYSDIAEAVGEEPADLELWGQIVKAYIGLGWNPGNVKNMLAYYEKREIPATKGQRAKGDTPSGPDEWLARRQEAGMGGSS